jgi:hypothetical protein
MKREVMRTSSGMAEHQETDAGISLGQEPL